MTQQCLFIDQFTTGSIPTVTDQRWFNPCELDPGEVMQRLPGLIQTNPWHACSIHEAGASAVPVKSNPFSASSLELMVHVAKHHKVCWAGLLHAIQSQGQIPITPVDMRLLPVATAGTVRL